MILNSFASTPSLYQLQIKKRLIFDGFYKPEAHCNLFDSIPIAWGVDESLILRGQLLIAELPNHMRHLFNAIFCEKDRFRKFCSSPSSLKGHHSEPFGNLRHSIETAEQASLLCTSRPQLHKGIVMLAALLHDAGKADEYQSKKGGWELTDRGKLLGHRVTIIEWIAIAVNKWNIAFPNEQYLALLHALTAIPHAPDWMGLRTPVTHESLILSTVDRLSGQDDLFRLSAASDGGWGKYHSHLKFTPFTLVANNEKS